MPTYVQHKDVEVVEFEHQTGCKAFQPYTAYNFGEARGTPANEEWKTITPVKAPPVPPGLSDVIKKAIQGAWRWTEPSSDRYGKSPFIGIHGERGDNFPQAFNFQYQAPPPKPQVFPAPKGMAVNKDESAIPKDWHLMHGINRVNAITFRGDTRAPGALMNDHQGFKPPDTRTDHQYLEGPIYQGFKYYFEKIYPGQKLGKQDFLAAINEVTRTPEQRKMFIDYMAWRGRMKGEASHLARACSNELLKGYISTTRSIDVAIKFGVQRGADAPYYIYVCEVHDGFVVPTADAEDTVIWGTGEAEIAQFGPIPVGRIQGFRKFQGANGVGPIYMRDSFRANEPQAFEAAFKILNGARPNQI